MTEELLDTIQRCLRISKIDEAIPIINSCISARNRVIQGSSDPDFKLGNIVLDTRDGEIGFVVGPVDVFEDKKLRSFGKKVNSYLESPDDYFVIITKKMGESNTRSFSFGVRYIKRKYLTPLGIDKQETNNSLSDLDIFCNQQCIMECNSECKLYKYKKK